MNNNGATHRKRSQGFSLLEVLIGVVVLSVGLLGLAALQLVGQRVNHSAYLRSQATLQAYSMAERMRANPRGVADGEYDAVAGIPGGDPDCTSASSCLSSGCDAAELAAYDACEWNLLNSFVLPSGQGTVTASAVVDEETFSITMRWDDNRDGLIDADDPAFDLEFRP